MTFCEMKKSLILIPIYMYDLQVKTGIMVTKMVVLVTWGLSIMLTQGGCYG